MLGKIPGTAFSIRIWPGSASVCQFSLNFVNSASEKPPPKAKYELYLANAAFRGNMHRIKSLEAAFCHGQVIEEGAESFLVSREARAGGRVVLMRPDGPGSFVGFKIPTHSKAPQPTYERIELVYANHLA
ncbi:unnamed protein product [Cyclocybe aegerita]|uniref:Uncharacterized protein n=1 Tax=Cyclocybe aegerita TaxID=1973307 RepID=A0A8S0XM79_CYCAE|nr:unnamed protein product [Cyclocybe aegerita]